MPTDAPVPGFFFRLSRSLAVGLIGLAIGVVRALREGLREVGVQGYRELGFDRNAALELSAAASRGLEQGLELGRTLAVMAFLILMLSWIFPPLRLGRIVRALRGTTGPPVAVFALALIVIWGLLALAQDRAVDGYAWLEASDVRVAALALTIGTVWIGVTMLFSAASSDEEPDPVPRSFLLLGIVLVGGGFWINRSVWTPPRDHDVFLRNAILVLVAVALFLAEQGRTRTWRLLVAGAALVSLAPFAVKVTTRSGPTLTAERPWNVVLIALDTVRADQTSLLGERPKGRDTTRNLRVLAEKGINFRHAISQAPWTIPAFASVLTGKYPHEHGAFVLSARLPGRNVMLPEVLREAGYETFGVVSHLFLQDFRGFGQGYDRYDETPTHVPNIERAATSMPVTESALAFLKERDGERPFFLFAHYFDPHYEYRNHQGWRYADDYDGWFEEQLVFENLLKNGRLLDERDLDWLMDLYHEELQYTDRHGGRVRDYLEQSGLMENRVVVIVADHGEEFREHGTFGHTTNLHQEVVHVPLVIVPPDLAEGVVVDETVETRRVFGTVLDLLGIDWGAGDEERSLLRFADGRAGEGPHRAFSSVWLGSTQAVHGKRFQKAALVEDRWKVIFDMTRGRTELYDLARDPGERAVLTGRHRERASALRGVLDAWIRRMQDIAADVESAGSRRGQDLSNLGYSGADEQEEEE